MTVKELVDILAQMPQSYKVYLQCSEDYMCFPLRRAIDDGNAEKTVTLFGASEDDEYA